jgi:hypothetical protein
MPKPETGLRNAFNRQPWGLKVAELTLAGGLALGACNSSGDSDSSTTPVLTVPGQTGMPKLKKVTFDDRGGGPNTIAVYPGPMDTPEDRVPFPRAYEDGESAQAYCVTGVGREVHTHPELGEDKDAPSSAWVEIVDTKEPPLPGGIAVKAWASAVYLQPFSLPDCAG